MIDNLKFLKLDNIEFNDLTDNTILFFKNKDALGEFKLEFENLINDSNYEYVHFSTTNENEIIQIKHVINCRDISRVYYINDNEQRIILTIEPIAMLLIKNHYDLWLIDKQENSKWNCIDFTAYQNHENYLTPDDIYQFICDSKYGCCGNNK